MSVIYAHTEQTLEIRAERTSKKDRSIVLLKSSLCLVRNDDDLIGLNIKEILALQPFLNNILRSLLTSISSSWQ